MQGVIEHEGTAEVSNSNAVAIERVGVLRTHREVESAVLLHKALLQLCSGHCRQQQLLGHQHLQQ